MEEKPKVVVLPARPQSERMKQYFAENKGKPWVNYLWFLLDTFPQVEGGKIQHLLYGGTAIKLLYPARQDPADIDTVTRSKQMAVELPPHQHTAQPIDVHSIEDWLKEHQLAQSEDLINFIFQQHQPVHFQGREILVMSSPLLAWSKMNIWHWHGQFKRPKDVEDLRMLNVDPKQVDDLTRILKGFK